MTYLNADWCGRQWLQVIRVQQVSRVRRQHLDDSDGEPLGLTERVQGGQQRNGGAGTEVRCAAALAQLDPRTHSLRGGGIFHWTGGAALYGRCGRRAACVTIPVFPLEKKRIEKKKSILVKIKESVIHVDSGQNIHIDADAAHSV